MNIANLIAITAVVTEFIKKALLKIKIEIKGAAAVVLAIIVSAGVVVVETLKLGGLSGSERSGFSSRSLSVARSVIRS